MLTLKGDRIELRALEPEDLDFLYRLENDLEVWEISGTTTPYSRHVLRNYLDNAHRDIYEVKQLRLCICDQEDQVLGLIDLFDFDPKNHRAGLGVIIIGDENRNKGLGAEAIGLLIDYAFSVLDLRQLYANVMESNEASVRLFKRLGFEEVGLKKDWVYSGGEYKNEILFQKRNI
ncbi:GNAT family N-acetyltransferase [Pareuzebyella sediminis]|uniref:GNAT family N-acetyltransferase n=1 Tax=Pareuzebyella sediminis TaxID=2607998 RepID=UPI0011ECA199|nr:GNAT family N-acetyltransferase [Pareuzebyella sediminis]